MVSVYGDVNPVFHLPLKGSLPLFFALTALYGFTSSGLGLLIATFARNLFQARMLVIFTFVPIILFSGIHTPDEGMPRWLHAIVLFNPGRTTSMLPIATCREERDSTWCGLPC